MATGKDSRARRRRRCPGHKMPTQVTVTGLREARANLEKLDQEVQKEIGRESLRAMGWALARPMRAATYTTFKRQDGHIRRGLSVAVAQQPQDEVFTAVVKEYPV